MTTIRRIQPLRRTAGALQALVILGLPFLQIGGESALRFDLQSLRLHFFGRALWMQEFFLVLAALLFFTFLIILVTILFGRIWCGWVCPQTVLTDLTGFADHPGGKSPVRKAGVLLLILLISGLVAANLIWYFVTPYDFFRRLMDRDLGQVITWSWPVMTVVLFADLAFVRHRFCATICPYSRMQSTMFDNRTMVLAFDPRRAEECLKCSACTRVCPVGIDIREGLSPACVNCAECMDKCSEIMEKKGKKGLIGYFFGVPGQGFTLMRRNVLPVLAVTLFLLVFLVLISAGRKPLDMTVMPANNLPPRVAADGTVINAYLIAFENRGSTELQVRLSASGGPPAISLAPSLIPVKPGEHKTATVFASAAELPAGALTYQFQITASYGKDAEEQLPHRAVFARPAAR